MKKRILALFLAVTLLLCIIPPLTPVANAAEADASEPLRYGRQILQSMDNADSLLATYDALVTGIANCESKISLNSDNSISSDDLHIVAELICSDYPEFFWLDRYSYSTSGNVVRYVSPVYTMTGTQLESAKAAVEASATLLLTGLEDKSDYEISKLIHDRLAAFMSYQYSNNNQTIYGALVERQAVCAGYARAYQYLMLRAGIPAWYITGSSYRPGSSTAEGHAWTLVCLDGNWYHSDLTWDDQGNLGNIYYAYLNVTTEYILQDHIIDPFFADILPSCTATSANYFVKEGTILSQFDVDAVVAELQDHNLRARLLLTYDFSQFWSDCSANIYTIIRKLGVNVSSYGYRKLESPRTDSQEVIFYLVGNSVQPAPTAITFNSLPARLVYEADALDVSGGMMTVHYDDTTTQQIAITADMISGYDPSVTGKQVLTVTYAGCKEYFTIENTAASVSPALPGDMNGDDQVTNDDVVALMWNILFPQDYPLTANTDLNKDGQVTNDDVVALMWNILFPDQYPLS